MLTKEEKTILSKFSIWFSKGLPVYRYSNSCSYFNNMLITNNSEEYKYIESHIDTSKLDYRRDVNHYPMIIYEKYVIKNHCIYDISFETVQKEIYGEGPSDCVYCNFNMRKNNDIFNCYCHICFHYMNKRIIRPNTIN